MGKKTKPRKPFDPAEAARLRAERERLTRRDPAKWGVNREAALLAANSDIVHEAETRTKVARVARYDVFALMHSREGITSQGLVCVRRLQEQLAIRHKTAGTVNMDRVDGGSAPGGLTDAQVEAGTQILDVVALTGVLTGNLLLALISPEIIHGQRVNWRNVTQAITGEVYPHGQAAIVRAAVANLMEAYKVYDNQPRRTRKVAA